MEKSTLPRKSEKSVKIGNIVTSNTPYRGKEPYSGPLDGGHLGDPYTIGGKRGTIPPASLSRVYSPPQQGLPLGCPWVWFPWHPKVG
jgi:hypothetical protein